MALVQLESSQFSHYLDLTMPENISREESGCSHVKFLSEVLLCVSVFCGVAYRTWGLRPAMQTLYY
jgi:hypothetical protein